MRRFFGFLGVLAFALPLAALGDAPPALPSIQTPYSQAQIDQLLAPIALYPDPLLAQILSASAYPVQIVQEDRWLQAPGNAGLMHDSLAFQTALSQQPWDQSVKALAPFPQVLQQLDANLQWTQDLGAALSAQQGDVLGSIQRLRAQAVAAGTLASNTQQVVGGTNGIITIEPANPGVLYTPYYNPATVYGVWAYPAYQPFYFAASPGVNVNGSFLAYGSGFVIVGSPFYRTHVNWQAQRVENAAAHTGPSLRPFTAPAAPHFPPSGPTPLKVIPQPVNPQPHPAFRVLPNGNGSTTGNAVVPQPVVR